MLDETVKVGVGSLDLFTTSVENMYKCAPETSVLGDNFKITFTEVSLIAFNTNDKISGRTGEQ